MDKPIVYSSPVYTVPVINSQEDLDYYNAIVSSAIPFMSSKMMSNGKEFRSVKIFATIVDKTEADYHREQIEIQRANEIGIVIDRDYYEDKQLIRVQILCSDLRIFPEEYECYKKPSPNQ